jgi:NAD-dependent dihydropyrimidine dehydrogenase PreA subunit
MPEVKIDYDKCAHCGTCVSVCPMGVYRDTGDRVEAANVEECVACMSCEPACPAGAITVRE